MILGFWIRLEQIENGERIGEDPGLVIDFSRYPSGRSSISQPAAASSARSRSASAHCLALRASSRACVATAHLTAFGAAEVGPVVELVQV